MDAWDIFNVVIKVVQAAFQVKKAVEVRKEAKYQTDILRQEAKQAKEDAADERQQGLDEARRIRLKSILNMSEMKSDIASNNILLSSKTALNLVTDEKLNGKFKFPPLISFKRECCCTWIRVCLIRRHISYHV